MKIIFVIIGALIGAGFASGQEMYLFFYKYGTNGIWGLLICSILIGLVIYKTFSIIKNNDIKDYKSFLNKIFNNNQIVVKFMNIVINMFLLVTFFIMISGFGAYFEQEFSINSIIGAIILAGVCFIVFMTNIKGITNVSSFIVPILIVCIVIIGFYNFSGLDFTSIGENVSELDTSWKWALQSFIYCSYNMILIIPILIDLKDYLKSKKQIGVISILSGLIVFILGLCIFMLLVNINGDFSTIEMPAVYAVSQSFSAFRTIYGMVILLSIFTTAVSIGYGFLTNVVKKESKLPVIAAIMCIASVVVSNIGFSNLLSFLFPLFGYLGLIQIFCILKIPSRNEK